MDSKISIVAMVPLVLSTNDRRSAIFRLEVVAVKMGFIAAKTIPLCSRIIQRKKEGGQELNRIKGRVEQGSRKNLLRTLVSSRHCITDNHAKQYMLQPFIYRLRLAACSFSNPFATYNTWCSW